MTATDLRQQAIDYLRQFIAIDSRSDARGGCEGQLQRVIAGHMRRLGARVRLVEVDDLPGLRQDPLFCGPDRQYRDRPTVIGEIGTPTSASAPGKPALLVCAHSDTVPLFAPDDWTVDPFGGELRDGRIYGLGAMDDKWGLAAMLILLQHVAEHPALTERRLIVASTIDEENGVGNGLLILHRAGVDAREALYLDGDSLTIHHGACGGSTLRLRPRQPIHDLDAHEAKLLQGAARLAEARQGLFDREAYRDNWARHRSVLVYRSNAHDEPGFRIAFYTLPQEQPESIERELVGMVRAALGEALEQYDLTVRQPWFEPALTDLNTPIARHMMSGVRQVLGREPVCATGPKCDAWVLTNYAGIPTVNFGAGGRVDGRGAFHNPDEYIEVDELWHGCQIVNHAVTRWLDAAQA